LQRIAASAFRKSVVQETKEQAEFQKILDTSIRDLGLSIAGSQLESFIARLYAELERKKIFKFRPVCYLSDEWGCPSGEPVIGVPFYLARPDLAQLEKVRNDLEDSREIMMYLRHEAGHAFNYAYKLHKTAEWKQLFGSFRRPYRDVYRPVPFSRDFVRHMAGWYAQKHPDEDFAETFAVWLTPRSGWRKRYRGWGAMAKLRYMDRIARKLGNTDPLRRRGQTDITVEEMEMTVGEFYQSTNAEIVIGDIINDADLMDIFDASKRRKSAQPANRFLNERRKSVVDKVAYWSGAQRPLIKRLVELIEQRSSDLGLWADTRREPEHLINLTVYTTALTMNYVARTKTASNGTK
jgi:hypothetical protein